MSAQTIIKTGVKSTRHGAGFFFSTLNTDTLL